MKIKNKTNRSVPVRTKDGKKFDLEPGDSADIDVANLEEIKRSVQIGENLTEVLPSSDRSQDLSEVRFYDGISLNG